MTFLWIRQHDSMQCGIACLRMALEYFGKEYSMEELSAFHALQLKNEDKNVGKMLEDKQTLKKRLYLYYLQQKERL